jgi:branched-chain amino acid transport system substrate-binding protein
MPISEATTAYFQKVNSEDGGACGREIALLVEDNENSEDAALDAVRRLVDDERVLAFIGNVGTASIDATVDFVNDPDGDDDPSDGVPNLFLSTGASRWADPENLEKWPWNVGYIPDFVSEGRILGTFVEQALSEDAVAAIHPESQVSSDGGTGFASSVDLVADIVAKATSSEINSAIRELHEEENPDTVFVYAHAAFTAQAISAAHADDWFPQFIFSYINSPTALAALLGGGAELDQLEEGFAELDGAVSTAHLLNPVHHPEHEAIVEHARIMETYGGPGVSTLSVYGQSLAELTVEALRRACGNLTREGLLDAVESIQGFSTSLLLPGIEINLSDTDHFPIQSLQPVRVESGGSVTPLGDVISLD